jgi:purine-nucleoside phosphorylase
MQPSKRLGRRTTAAHTEKQRVDALAHALETRAHTAGLKQAPTVGVVLGSGLGEFAEDLENSCAAPFADLPHMAQSGVAGHRGRFVIGTLAGVSVCAMQGRVHLYEGHAPSDVVRGVRAMIAFGAKNIVLTNAAGGIRKDLEPGDLMLIEDHLNLTGQSPLTGPNDDALGPRFPALSDAYDPELRKLAAAVARAQKLRIPSGVYAGLLGPAYETPAEVRMVRTLGGDAVGMSTVLETIAARHMGARVLGISCITNLAAGLSATAPSHEEVQETARAAEKKFRRLLTGVIKACGGVNKSTGKGQRGKR